ncbi:hypothetical protein BDV95DRAFT_596792 [Massariosphaeria phaeospora]|uniref:Uncharacterized protein n=1 Tax=Massariosphaeria phaeospora TaxID=100035 RepID=A0A7C8I667_9PLEO|nr:hypothetical protein BDV95DRAFT_596792 [Massariosphaeria phaeospora]
MSEEHPAGNAGWDEVLRMVDAASAADAQIADEYPQAEVIERWMRLFGYSRMEAAQLISQQRGDVTRDRIPSAHWTLIRASKEALGFDREAYEHSLQLPKVFKEASATISTTGEDGATMLLFRLGGLLSSAEKVREVAGLEELPRTVKGVDGGGREAAFCCVDRGAQGRLEAWLTLQAVLQGGSWAEGGRLIA